VKFVKGAFPLADEYSVKPQIFRGKKQIKMAQIGRRELLFAEPREQIVEKLKISLVFKKFFTVDPGRSPGVRRHFIRRKRKKDTPLKRRCPRHFSFAGHIFSVRRAKECQKDEK
jgi:hypothetical protein